MDNTKKNENLQLIKINNKYKTKIISKIYTTTK